MKLITAFFFYFGVFLIGILPFPVIYGLSSFVRFLLHRIFSYRKEVIVSNLKLALPETSEAEHKVLVKKIYKNLSDVLLEGIKAFSMTRNQITRRHKVLNPEIIQPYLESKQDLIGLTAHYANWEWGSLSASTQINAPVIAFYKRLKNQFIDGFVRHSRMKFGTKLASILNTSETFSNNIGQTTVFVMAADQSTIKRSLNQAYWVNFFGKETPFLHGPEKYARLYNLPVIYIDIQRVRRGFYEIELSVLVDNPSILNDGEITERYARKLEEVIRKKPENWLWSHRRWRLAR